MVFVRVFISYSRQDINKVEELYKQLCNIDYLQVWLDNKNLLPGQDWKREIKKEIRNSDVFLACISSSSINKRGYVQKELRLAKEIADEIPPGQIYRIPVRLDNCNIPEQFERIHWVDYPHNFDLLYRTLEQIYQDKLISTDSINSYDNNGIYKQFVNQIKFTLSKDEDWRDWSNSFPTFSLLGYREKPTQIDLFALVKADSLIERQIVELRKIFFSIVLYEARDFGLVPGMRKPNGLLGFVFENDVCPKFCDFIRKQTEIDHSLKGAVMVSWVIDLQNRRIIHHNNPVSWMPPVTIWPLFVYPGKLLESEINTFNIK